MMWLSLAIVILTFVAVMLVAGNNLSVCIGPAVGSRIISKRFGMLLGAVGFAVGLLIQGTEMTKTIATLLPNISMQLRAEALLVAIIVFLVADVLRTPLSFTMSLVGLIAGFSITASEMTKMLYVAEVVSVWVAAPLISIFFAFYLIKLLNREPVHNLWDRLQTYKVLLIVLAFSTSYVLGANTLGLIVSTSGFNIFNLTAAVVGAFIGVYFLSAGEIRRVAEELFLMRYPNATVSLVASTVLVEIATILKIPLSNTQALSGAVFGTGMSYKSKFVSLKPFLLTVLGWVIAPLLSFVLGIVIAKI
ncbi:MAG TPA: inorganic phosphate transporter [Candidatus Limnocylindrales bacterium]|nr:inorganic phosphate transporter [Candidatus Limnocylindrales bacterium]